jgi:hypothetical protein
MLLGLATLLTALCISGIAAYYSIVGLTAIFAAAVFPVILMGSVLEVGKVVTTLWLHYNWERAPWKIKSYLVSAVSILMLITSMGIFGFLSKAHLEQAVPSGDVQAQVSLFDEKIKTQRDNIESDRKALAQMDTSVDQMMSRTVDDTGAQKSANLRQSQKKERARLQQDIDDSQKAITKLQEERAPVASKLRKVEAEVGPIKYIAALIYGDKADQNMLEAAVRWVIIIIVAVFDPLAIILLLAATTSIDWSKLDRKKRKHDELEEAKEKAELVKLEKAADITPLFNGEMADIDKIVSDTQALTRAAVEDEYQALIDVEKARIKEIEEMIASQQGIIDEYVTLAKNHESKVAEFEHYATLLGEENQDSNEKLAAARTEIDELSVELAELTAQYNELLKERDILLARLATENDAEIELGNKVTELEDKLTVVSQMLFEKSSEVEALNNELNLITSAIEIVEPAPAVTPMEEVVVVEEPFTTPLPLIEEIIDAVVPKVQPAPPMPVPAPLPVMTKVASLTPDDNFPLGGNASFGTTFPANPIKGDLFLRVDYMPSKLFKWVGNWIEMDKAASDTYAYDQEYIKLLIDKVNTGEYDVDDLSQLEQDQIADYLKNNK